MKFLNQTLKATFVLCVLAAGASAFEPQKNDQKGPPPKDPKVVEKPDKPPPPRDDKKNEDRGRGGRGNRP